MQCKQSECEADAVFVVHWPGKDIEQCEMHTEKLRVIGSAMGMFVSATPLPVDEEREEPTCHE